MKKVLLIGDHPSSTSGNGGMMNEILRQIEEKGEYEASVFALQSFGYDPINDVNTKYPFNIITGSLPHDRLGKENLIKTLNITEAKYVIIVGLDIWAYVEIFKQIQEIRTQKGFILSAIFPFDIRTVRKDWINWINFFDFPCVYSQYGYNSLKFHVPNLRYFRPTLHSPDKWEPYPEEKKLYVKKKMFPGYKKDELVFGFVGVNQIRKDPQKVIRAYSLVRKEIPNSSIYLHCDPTKGVFNLYQYSMDCGYKPGWLRGKGNGRDFLIKEMVDLYNVIDVLVNCSIQEGLSWTPLEAMLCGCPVIATDTTSQTEIVKGAGVLVEQTIPTYVPLVGARGASFIDAMTCTPEAIAEKMILVGKDPALRDKMRRDGLHKAQDWLRGADNVNGLLKDMEGKKVVVIPVAQKIDKILFMQHSSAGDVLMTTQCFKGLKERHPGKELVYMTQKQYMGIIEGNPYVEGIIDWDPKEAKKYVYVYNPHGDKITPGQWGRNANTLLADFYWKLVGVEPDGMYINPVKPEYVFDIEGKKIILVHTTGGSAKHRTYKYMGEVCSMIRAEKNDFITIQIGSGQDHPAGADIDLRDRLSFRETAWVVERADYAITVDSFVSHIVGVFGIPQVCLFGTGNAGVVRPKQKENTLICLSPDYVKYCPGLGPCSGAVTCEHICCTSMHSPEVVYRLLGELVKDSKQSIVKFYFTEKKGLDYEFAYDSRK